MKQPSSPGGNSPGRRPLPVQTVAALALDLDGTTLRPDAVLSGTVAGALRTCVRRGVEVILCTGRSVLAAEPYRRAIGAEGPMVYFNGAVVTDPGGGGEPDLAFLDPGIAGYCAELARRRGVYFHVFLLRSSSAGGWENRELLMAEEERDETEFYRKRTGLSPVIGDIPGTLAALGEKAPETPGRPSAAAGCIKGMFIAEPPVPDEIRTELEARYPGRLYLARSSRTFLEVMTAGVSKGRGLRLAMERRGLDPAGVIALGDEENDLPMFSAAGYSAAPASAAPQVRKAADFVFPSNAEDGVAAFLREIFDI